MEAGWIEKARRDAASWQSALERLRQDADRAKQDAATSRAWGELIGRIRTYEQILEQELRPEEELAAMSIDELHAILADLQKQFQGSGRS